MANLIELAKSYVPMLDEVYKLASCTSDLDGAPELARQGANANELIIPMLEMDGLADYDRNGGYVAGDVKMLIKSATLGTVIGSGKIKQIAPYAAWQYYRTDITRKYDPRRGAYWFERMKADHRTYILKGAAEKAGAKYNE